MNGGAGSPKLKREDRDEEGFVGLVTADALELGPTASDPHKTYHCLAIFLRPSFRGGTLA